MAQAHDFHSWVKEYGEHCGIIFRDEDDVPEPGKPGEAAGVAKVKYVPYPTLQKYWTAGKINQVLTDAGLTSILAEDISSNFLRIFSILVIIIDKDLKLPYLQRFMNADFTDGSLPLTRDNKTRNNTVLFTDSKIDNEAFEAFNVHQFRFNHIQFTRTNHYKLNEQMIIPVIFDKWLTAVGYGKPAIALCTVPSSEAIGLDVKDNGKIVVKVCDLENDEESFSSETDAYIAFKNLGSRHNSNGISYDYHEFFLRYYGSFVQGTKGLLFVEYANQRSLKQFFESNRPPHILDELVKFWESFNEVFVGLHWLHTGSSGNIRLLKELEKVHGLKTVPEGEGKLRIEGVHQDIKPDNIFVFRNDDKEKYSLQFKIGDLGSSSIRVTRRSAPEVSSHRENQSTKMYNAPELFNPHPDMAEGTTITREADIWSLGCVMAEAAVWSICGADGLIEFWEARREETMKQEYRIAGESSYFGAFHNGRKLLPNFDGLMAAMLGRKRVFDNVTEVVIDLVKDRMLVPLTERRNYKTEDIRCELERLLLRAKEARARSRNDTYLSEGLRKAPLGLLEGGRRPDSAHHQRAVIYMEHGGVLVPAEITLTPLYDVSHAIPQPGVQSNLPQPALRPPVPAQVSGPATQITESSEPLQPATQTVIPHQTASTKTPLHTPLQTTALPTQGSESSKLPRPAPQPVVVRQTESRTRHPTSTLSRSTSAAAIAKLPLNEIIQYTKTDILKHHLKTERAKKIGARLRENKQIFILQDSTSIRSCHWDKVSSTFAALTYLLETKELGAKSEKNMHLHLTSMPTNPFRKKPDEQRLTVAGAQPTRGGPASETAKGLTQIIQEIAKFLSQNKPNHAFLKPKTATVAGEGMDIYLLTDGVWDDIGADTGSPKLPDLEPFEREMNGLVNLLPGAKLSIRMILVRDDEVARGLSAQFESLEKAWSFSHCLYDWTDAWGMLTSGE